MAIAWIIAFLIMAIFFATSVKNGKIILSNNKALSSLSFDDLYNSFTLEVDKIEDISIKLLDEVLKIEKSNDDKVYIELYGSWDMKNEPVFSYKNNILLIEQKNTTSFYHKLLVLKLPENAISKNTNLNVDMKSGSIELSQFDLNKLSLSNVSGSTKVLESKFNVADINNVSGTIRIENCDITELKTNSVSGSIYAEGTFSKADSNVVSGGISITNKKDFEKDSSFNAVSGTITIELPENNNAKLKCETKSGTVRNELTNSKGKNITESMGNGTYSLEASTESGSITITKN